jgi:hypothetical protein
MPTSFAFSLPISSKLLFPLKVNLATGPLSCDFKKGETPIKQKKREKYFKAGVSFLVISYYNYKYLSLALKENEFLTTQ